MFPLFDQIPITHCRRGHGDVQHSRQVRRFFAFAATLKFFGQEIELSQNGRNCESLTDHYYHDQKSHCFADYPAHGYIVRIAEQVLSQLLNL